MQACRQIGSGVHGRKVTFYRRSKIDAAPPRRPAVIAWRAQCYTGCLENDGINKRTGTRFNRARVARNNGTRPRRDSDVCRIDSTFAYVSITYPITRVRIKHYRPTFYGMLATESNCERVPACRVNVSSRCENEERKKEESGLLSLL